MQPNNALHLHVRLPSRFLQGQGPRRKPVIKLAKTLGGTKIRHKILFITILSIVFAHATNAGTSCPTKQNVNIDPIAEHPSGEFDSSLEAMSTAFSRILSCNEPERWVVLSGQGQGWRPDSYLIADVEYRNGEFVFPEPIPKIASYADEVGLDGSLLEISSDLTRLKVTNVSPKQLARLLDTIFREHFKVRPHDNEDDYAFGAEWL